MKTNNTFSIDEIIEQYADMVYRIALTQMKNIHDAQDIFQEVFLRLVKYIDTIENQEHLKSWLIRVTLNCSKTSLMSAWRKHTQPLELDEEQQQNPFQTQEQSELYEQIQELPQKYRIVLYLFYYEELSIKEICIATNQRETTVKSQLSRGRKMLKERLLKLGWHNGTFKE